jgi:hypothetical protein
MSRVCREASVIVEIVEPSWVAWTTENFVENFADQWI